MKNDPLTEKIKKVAQAKFGHDERTKPKFVELALKIVRCGRVNQSLDWIPNTEYELASQVLGAVTFVKSFECFSDKCLPKIIEKLEQDYESDLKTKQTTNV